MPATLHTPWVVIGCFIAIILVLAAIELLRAWRRFRVPWQDLPGYYRGSRWFSLVTIDPKDITEALQAAESFLIARTRWSAANLALVGHYVRVYVESGESWKELYGQRLLSQQADHHLVVGPSLSALCHEMAHLCERVLDNRPDPEHEAWVGDGVTAALDDFDAWLLRRRNERREVSEANGIIPVSPLKSLRKMNACRYTEPTK